MFSFFLTLFALILSSVLCAPVPNPAGSEPTVANATLSDLEKRVTHVGRATWFHTGHGNCGSWDTDDHPIFAVSSAMYQGGKNCNQWAQLTNTKNGKTAYARMRDSCPSCGYNDIDLSPAAFEALEPLDDGVFTVSWHFMNRNFSP
ncbi:hypothetical protein FRC06_006105 [Ceratobasidium sp. 370]|nr:hypothetical protein FRC06_006105 [Ceratobasidium sp. 370]